jgi:hypothetical protein
MGGVESEGGGLAGGAVKGLFGQVTFPLQRHKVRISLVEAPPDLLGCLDVVKVCCCLGLFCQVYSRPGKLLIWLIVEEDSLGCFNGAKVCRWSWVLWTTEGKLLVCSLLGVLAKGSCIETLGSLDVAKLSDPVSFVS